MRALPMDGRNLPFDHYFLNDGSYNLKNGRRNWQRIWQKTELSSVR
jgi:hypothetical protein